VDDIEIEFRYSEASFNIVKTHTKKRDMYHYKVTVPTNQTSHIHYQLKDRFNFIYNSFALLGW